MTEREAAPAAANPSDSRNLVMRIAVAAVLIPLAVAIAYAGGWLWTALVTLAAIGLFVEWLAIVGLAGAGRVTVPGVAALAVAGLCFAIGRLDVALIVLGVRPRRGGLDRAGAARMGGGGIPVRGGGRDRVGAGAPRSRQGIRRADVRAADRMGDRQRRLFRGPRHWRPEALATRQPEKDLGGRRRRICRQPGCGGRLCRRSIWAESGRY